MVSALARRALIAVGAFVTLGALAVGGPQLWIHTSASGRSYDVSSAPSRDVALVLGAGLRVDGTPTPYLAARLDLARDLYQRGAVKVILVSGDNRSSDYDEPSAMRRYLVKAGVPDRRIVSDYAGLDTYDSCYRAREIFGVRSATVVTQSYHLPRALALCNALGLDAVGVGDETGRSAPQTWAAGEQREVLAGVKAAWDVASHRRPILGPKETAVSDALTNPDVW